MAGRNEISVRVDARELDLTWIQAGVPVDVEVLSAGTHVGATISRPPVGTDPLTQAGHFEVDIFDPEGRLPVGATAIVRVARGSARPATQIPTDAATRQLGTARLFSVRGERARLLSLPVLGESQGGLYFAPQVLPAGTWVVTDGRSLLSDGDWVEPHFWPRE